MKASELTGKEKANIESGYGWGKPTPTFNYSGAGEGYGTGDGGGSGLYILSPDDRKKPSYYHSHGVTINHLCRMTIKPVEISIEAAHR